mgnify:CR=1 FL=1
MRRQSFHASRAPSRWNRMTLQIEAIKKVTVTEQVMEKIADLITSGQLKPGEQLPNERDLARMFGVARGRIREALRALSVIGLIAIRAGEGSFVKEQEVSIPPETIIWMFHNERKNFYEIYMARQLIESEVYALGARKAGREQIARLEEYLARLRQERDVEKFADILDQFDILMAQCSQVQIYVKLMQTIIYLRRESSIKLLGIPGSPENSLRTRTRLVQAMKEGDGKKIGQAIRHHFQTLKKFYETIFPSA